MKDFLIGAGKTMAIILVTLYVKDAIDKQLLVRKAKADAAGAVVAK